MKHTPGPWLIDGRTVYALQHGGWRKGKEVLVNRFSAHVQRVPDCPEGEAEANARLIASAPDLLAENEMLRDYVRQMMNVPEFARNHMKDQCIAELLAALKMLVAHCEAGLDDESDLEFARAAIAKAEGE